MHHVVRAGRHRGLVPLILALVVLTGGAPATQAQVPAGQPARPAAPPAAGAPSQDAGTLTGIVSTQNGTIVLGGAVVSLVGPSGEVGSYVSDGEGAFRFENVPPGTYTVVATLEGFDPFTAPVVVAVGRASELKADLRIATVSERVDVVASSPILPTTGTLTVSEGLTSKQLDELTAGGGLQAALRLLASVIEVPGGVSIKGGRPSQASVQLGPGAFVDPATGLNPVTLPDDAIDSVTVLPNPYSVEYGRFSSGLVLIRTRRASERWRTRLNNLDPAFRTRRGSPWHILGISAFSPRVETGGPLIKDRFYLQQALQYRYRVNDVPSRPQSEVRTSQRFSSFTRLDANLNSRHSVIGAAGFFPARATQSNLGTFIPPDAAVDTKGNVNTVSFTERSIWSDRLFAETTVEAHSYDTDVMPRGPLGMQLLPETTLGNFFNRQHRHTATFQVIESISGSARGRGGLHLYKAGVDVLHNRFGGWSMSRPVLIRRSDGTLVRRLDYPSTQAAPTQQELNSTDLAIYAQDRMQPGQRYYVEFGARLDRDGVLGRLNLTPRLGVAVLLNAAGTSVVRSGYGLFYERTPSVAGVFEQYEAPLDTRYRADGLTVASSMPQRHVSSPDLRTARSFTWDVAFDHRFNARWATHLSTIDRRGRRELLLNRSIVDGGAVVLLDSNGRSQYREIEAGVHYTGPRGIDINASYTRSLARSDLNAYTFFYDSIINPVVAENGYGPARTEVPHRLLVRGRSNPLPDWLLVGVLDWRSNLPFSVVDEALDFVGPRNNRRLPTYVRVDLGLEHRFTFGKLRPWIGVRVDNAFANFLPQDAQANITSPAFGGFYNSEIRQARIQVRFER